MTFDAYGLRLTRIEVFHSGNSTEFDISLENSTPNTGESYDPRNVFVDYLGIAGSVDYTSGIDQVESLLGLTDPFGKLYLKVKPSAGDGGFLTGSNSFKYLTFFEVIAIYI
ncbi:MAG: hypothetical protein Q8Q92_03515 [bacterium]|nr:hypothetical protein [bacterium]